jgi:hypothetical protein
MPYSSNKLRIIVGGMVGQFPLGGVAWDYFHYVLALHELGHDVYYHEDTNTWPYNPSIRQPSSDGIYNAQFIDNFFKQYAPELADRWHYRLLQNETFGMSATAFAEVARSCDVYLNVSGVCRLPGELPDKCRKIFLDSDPGYNQFGLQDLLDNEGDSAPRYIEVARDHDVHFTYAENIHQPDCLLPHAGIQWLTTRPVVTLSHWSAGLKQLPLVNAAYTTVMTLDLTKEPKRLHYKGTDYYDKRIEFEKCIHLPGRVKDITLTLAVGNNNSLQPVLDAGWRIIDSHEVSLSPGAYHDFIINSAGEWSIAKNVYAATRSGWFSCRTCCYLAAGRPAVVQETAWSQYIPSGNGIIAFNTLEEAAEGLKRIAAEPSKNQRAAYDIAREYFAPDRVINKMLRDIFSRSR